MQAAPTGPNESPWMHVIVDNLRPDPWAITAGIAAIVAAIVAIVTLLVTFRAFEAAKAELKLAEVQLKATEDATRQTQEALDLGHQQLEYMQKADLDRVRALAPRVTARMELGALGDRYVMHLSNSGAVASYLQVTGYDAAGQFHNPFIQKLDPGEDLIRTEFFLVPSQQQSYCQKIRIRARDVLGNKYITEYNSLGVTLAFPIFRLPWLGEGIAPRPEHCSDEVSWEVEHFERFPGEGAESLEEGFNIDAPV